MAGAAAELAEPRAVESPPPAHGVVAPRQAAMIDFRPDSPGTDHSLSRREWLSRIRDLFGEDPDLLNRSQPATGLASLRQALSDYLAATRGVRASPEQIFVVSGRRQACHLVAHLVLRRGQAAVVESPGDAGVRSFFQARGAAIESVEVDEFGLVTEQLPAGPTALAYVTPARQNPIGGTLSYGRRRELLAWARSVGAYIIEEDCDSDFRYGAAPPPALAAIDPHGLVFHIGSFQRSLGAGLGVGYLVAPPAFVEAIESIQAMSDGAAGALEQAVIAGLLVDGGYDRHLHRLRKVYMERRDCLIDALRSHFHELRLVGQDLGLQLTWMLPEGGPTARAVAWQARTMGVSVEHLAADSRARRFRDRALILGYGAMRPEELQRGVSWLADAVTHCNECINSSPFMARGAPIGCPAEA